MIAIETDGIFSDGMADTVTYSDGTTSSAISAVVEYSGDRAGDFASILVTKQAVPAPDYRHTFTIDSVVWYVRPADKGKNFVLAQDDNMVLLAISKNERFSQWRP